MTITTGRITSNWQKRWWWFRGKKRYWFSVGLGLFFVSVERV